ncbi:MAG: hypothetical protein EZS28_019657 [Streblomastix strix]|uniref:Tyr recombinase domain-containing protein n=1 Tax=Streblomastix strix TaxID=222440 RepID=A0A5J4VQQ1_9EUKA|nr:MAG: hypothetical protein EZS28_019657 [Streblomastix strix]
MPLPQRLIQQVMKVHVRETAKVKGEEEIWHLDVLLNYIRLLAVDINLSSTVTRAACMASLIAFINLRLSELYDANILSISDQEVKLETMIWKDSQGRVQLILRQMKNDLSCPVLWILKWRKFCTYMTDFTQTPWGLISRDLCSKHIRELMRNAGIQGQIRVTQIRAAALTKLLSNGASKEETDRWSRHASTADTVRRFYDKTGNDKARKLLSSSFNSSISMDRGKEPRRGGSAQSPGYATPSSRGELASELPPKRHQSLSTPKKKRRQRRK